MQSIDSSTHESRYKLGSTRHVRDRDCDRDGKFTQYESTDKEIGIQSGTSTWVDKLRQLSKDELIDKMLKRSKKIQIKTSN